MRIIQLLNKNFLISFLEVEFIHTFKSQLMEIGFHIDLLYFIRHFCETKHICGHCGDDWRVAEKPSPS